MIADWTKKYVGIPFKPKVDDCWQLIRRVLLNEFGVRTRSFLDDYNEALVRSQIHECYGEERGRWRQVPPGEEQTGDVLVFRVVGIPCHVGIVAGDKRMLHTMKGTDSAVERYDGARWKGRLHGIYRHPEM